MSAPVRERLVMSDSTVAGRLQEAAAAHLATLTNGGGVLDKRVINGATGVYNHFRKASCATGQTEGHVTYFKLAQALYPGIRDGADARRKETAIRLQLRRLQAAGVMKVTVDKALGGQDVGMWWGLDDAEPDPSAWPDSYKREARKISSRLPQDRRGVAFELVARKRSRRRRADQCVHKYNRRIGHGSDHRYEVVSPFFAGTFCGATSLPTSPTGSGQAKEVGERRAKADSRSRPFAALSRCRTAASRGGVRAVLDVPRAGLAAKVVAAFEACFLPNGSSWRGVAPGDPRFLERPGQYLGQAPAWVDEVPPHDPDRYVLLSAEWTRKLETWCHTYDRHVREPGAALRSVIEDMAAWHPDDGAPARVNVLSGRRRREGEIDVDPGAPIGPAYFVARLGRRTKWARCGTDTDKRRRRRLNMIEWSEGDRW